jgi:hypothetical protein
MKKILKPLAYVVIIIAIVIIAIISYVVFALPNVGPAENIKVELTPQRIERGKYLATNVAVCLDCHTQQDWSKFGHPIDTNRLGAGGEKFDSGAGFPGNVTVPNITPYKISSWTDGELFRAITTGVKKDGTPIFPLMPWPYYSKMDKEIGSLEKGKLADLIVLNQNPLDDIKNSNNIKYVMLNGRLYDSDSMNEIGNHEKLRGRFWWQQNRGDSVTLPVGNTETYLFMSENGD